MKKRIIAVLLALCVFSVNTAGVYAAASDGMTSEVAAVEEEVLPTEERGEESVSADSNGEETDHEYPDEYAGEEQQDDSDDTDASVDHEQDDSEQAKDSSLESDEDRADNEEQEESASDDQNSDSSATSEKSVEEDSAESASYLDEISEAGSTIVSEEQKLDDSNVAKEGVIASGTCGKDGDNITWELIDGILAISGSGEMENYDGNNRSPWSRYQSDILAVEIGNKVTNIGNCAFSGCKGLKSITIPESVTSIGGSAFSGCNSLINITIPNEVTSIGTYAFSNCIGLSSITIPDGITSIGAGTFQYCNSLMSITIPGGVTSIGGSAFLYCTGLKSITIPDGVTSIGGSAFLHCTGLKSITIPKGVSSIERYVFSNCTGLTNITIPDGVTSIGESAFSGCSGLTNITIPDRVTSIGASAFYDCSSLTNITIPEGVTSIGSYTFFNCSTLTSIALPEGVTDIGYNAFSGCFRLHEIHISNLKSWLELKGTAPRGQLYLNDELINDIVIPEGVTSIRDNAFYKCNSLKSIIFPDGVTSIGKSAFSGCSGLTNITIPAEVTSIGGEAFSGCSSLTNITVPDGMTSLEDGVFAYCSSLTSITIPNGVTSIGESVFRGCSGLARITIPEGVTSIGTMAFYDCSGLTSVTIPEGVTSIGASAFNGCSGLTSITIPKGVTSIEANTFEGCSGLISITIPEEVTRIGGEAFWNCSSLTSITIPNSVTSIGYGTFKNCSSLTSITIPDGVTSIGGAAFSGCSGLTSLIIPAGVTSIGNSAFNGCSELTSINIPDGVTSIEAYTFSNTRAYVYIPMSVTTISNIAFKDGYYFDFKGKVLYEGTIEEWNSIYSGPEVNVDNRYIEFETDELILEVNQAHTLKINCSIYYSEDDIKWSTSDHTIVSIDDKGNITAEQPGEAVITAALGDLQCQMHVIVFLRATGIKLNESSINVFHGETYDLIATVEPENASNKNVIWESSNPEIATVDNTGHVVPLLTGTATITATSESEGFKASCVISVSHDWEKEYTIDLEPSCTEKGSKSIHCKGCDETKDIQEITALGHDWESEFTFDVEPTCTEKGSKSIHCKRCDEKKDVQEIDFEHDWESDYTIDVEPTCTEKGSKSIHCKRCEERKNIQEIPVEHDWEQDYTVDLEPTCTEKGSRSIHCKRCEEKNNVEEIPALGHSFTKYVLNPQEGFKVAECDHGCGTKDTIEVAQTTSGTCGSGVTWKLYDYDGGILYIKGTGAMAEYDAGKPSPWSALEFTSCVVESGVTSIGGAAFENCKTLEKVELADSVTSIGGYAFYNCAKLKDCKMSGGIRTIGASAFEKCSSLEELAFNEKDTVSFGKNALKSCSGLNIVGFNGTTAETTAEEYGYPFVSMGAIGSCGTSANYVFKQADGSLAISGSGAVRDYIVNTLTGKSGAPWSDFEVKSVSIGSSITGIGDGAFAGCGKIETLVLPSKVTSIGDYVCMGCTSLKNVTFDGTISTLPIGTFKGCSSLNSVSGLGNNLTTIQAEVFEDCTSLKRISLPDKVTRIEDDAFNGAGLIGVSLPSSLKYIGKGAFSGTEINGVTIPAATTNLIESAFWNCQNLETIEVNSSNSKYASTDGILTTKDGSKIILCPAGKEGTVTLPHRVSEIKENAFAGCSKITELSLSEGLETIGEGAFSGMTFSHIDVPSTVTSIGDKVFRDCSNLASINVAEDSEYFASVDGILYDAELTRLVACPVTDEGTVQIPESVRRIADYAFAGNKGISEATIPYWVNSIGDNAFSESGITIRGYDNSYAKEYAEKNGINFVSLEGTYCVKETIIGEIIDAHELIGKSLSDEEITGWRSNDHQIATVDEKGIVTILSDGEVRINVDSDGFTESCMLKVYKHWGYNIEFAANGGKGTMVPMQGVSLDDTYELSRNAFTRYGYSFYKWSYMDAEGSKFTLLDQDLVSDLAGNGETIVLTAQWTPTSTKHYIWAGGTTTGPEDYEYIIVPSTGYLLTYFSLTGSGISMSSSYDDVRTAPENYSLGNLPAGSYSLTWKVRSYSEVQTDMRLVRDSQGNYSYQYVYEKRWGAAIYTYRTTIIVNSAGVPAEQTISINKASVDEIESVHKYSGRSITPITAIRYNDIRLLEGRDYTVEYKNNVNVGQAQATIKGKGRFTGTITEYFWIVENEGDKVSLLNDETEVTGLDTCIYNGKPHVLTNIKVRIGNILLEKDKDYTLEFNDNISVGKGKVLITGMGIYKDTINAEFTIRADSVAYADISGITDKVYTGKEITQSIIVKFGETVLTEGKDYTVSYRNNVNAGTATVVITGKGTYDGTTEKTFTIGKAERSIEAALSEEAVVAGKTATIVIKDVTEGIVCTSQDSSIATVSGTTITGINVGSTKITVTVDETVNYKKATTEVELRVLPGKTTRGDMFNLANNVKVTWKEVPGAIYYKVYREGITNPKESLTEPVIVTTSLIGWDKQPGLTNGNAYRYKIVASTTGKGDPSGDSPLSYSKLMYRLKTVVIRSAKNTGPGAVTVKYDKTSSGDSYVLQYSQKQDMSNAMTRVIKGAANTTHLIGGLKKGKTYYISIRVRKKVNGIDYYTTFGVPKKVIITK